MAFHSMLNYFEFTPDNSHDMSNWKFHFRSVALDSTGRLCAMIVLVDSK